MKKAIVSSLQILALSMAIFSCSKSDTITAIPVVTTTTNIVKDLMADTIIGNGPTGPYGAGKYTFYSLENNAIISNTDSASTKWDIALAGTKILTNGGTSGTGQGGAFVYTGLFDDLKTISADSIILSPHEQEEDWLLEPLLENMRRSKLLVIIKEAPHWQLPLLMLISLASNVTIPLDIATNQTVQKLSK